jgi:diaminobutyrate-2-oxoglutarate transaminase
MKIFNALESEVRSYCRTWPAIFDRSIGSWLYDENGRPYLDFFAGAGALNYGHNNPVIKRALVDYLTRDGVIHSLDMFTAAKRGFLAALSDTILVPRDLRYKIQFPGPGGANAVEAALKLARKVTGRTGILSFTNAFHGMTLGALSVSDQEYRRACAGMPLTHVQHMPFDQRRDGGSVDLSALIKLLTSGPSGESTTAAVIVETVQGEGGVNVARNEWLRALADTCRSHGVLLIVDDIQVGCGRTGPFFSFEAAGIVPDIVCLSKSISGFGLPLALTLFKPELDIWEPGEHNGTFRGPCPSFVTATAALEAYWRDDRLERSTARKAKRVQETLEDLVAASPQDLIEVRSKGLIAGLEFYRRELAERVVAAAFENGLLVETAGPRSDVVKLLPPLTISDDELDEGLRRLAAAVRSVS